MKKEIKLRGVIFSALLVAIAVVLKVYLGIPVNMFGGFIKDINLSPSVIMLAGIYMGPLYGGIVGGLTDILAFIIRPLGAYNPLFTITNILMGVIPGLFFMHNEEHSLKRVAVAVAVTQTICSFIVNTLILIILGYMPAKIAWFRALSTFVLLPVHIFIVYTILKTLDKAITIDMKG